MENYSDGKRSHRKCSACGALVAFGKMTAHIDSYNCWCAVQEKKGLLTYTGGGAFRCYDRQTLLYFSDEVHEKLPGTKAYACSKDKFKALELLAKWLSKQPTRFAYTTDATSLIARLLPSTKILNLQEVEALQFQLELME